MIVGAVLSVIFMLIGGAFKFVGHPHEATHWILLGIWIAIWATA